MRRNMLVVLEWVSFFGIFFSGFESICALIYSDHLISFPVYIGRPVIFAFLWMWYKWCIWKNDLEEDR